MQEIRVLVINKGKKIGGDHAPKLKFTLAEQNLRVRFILADAAEVYMTLSKL